jgi:hypothetical protein
VTYPKALTCEQPIPEAAPRVDCFSPTVDLPLRRNDNKVVIRNAPAIVLNKITVKT